MEKIIGVIDIDGVITSLDYLKSKTIANIAINLNSPDPGTYRLYRELLYKISLLTILKSKARPEAIEVISALQNQNVEINIVTKRPFATEDSKEGQRIRLETETFLINNGIPYERLKYSTGNKIAECRELGANFIIEDNPQKALELAQEFKVILLSTPYNQGIKGNNIYRVNNWYEIPGTINKIIGQKGITI